MKRADVTGNPQGQFGSEADVQWALDQARYLEIGERVVVDAPAGTLNILHMPDGSFVYAPQVFVEVKPAGSSGTIHTFPVQDNYTVTQRK